jgi:thymidylate synthase (FAD)
LKIAKISVELIGHYGDDKTVANAARVSFHKDAKNYTDEQNHKLITYLAKHKHHSPFNHAFLSFRVKAPVFVGRQLVKHKFLPWNEVSRRYVDDEPEFFLPDTWRARPESNVKQGSAGEIKLEDVLDADPEWGDYWPYDVMRASLMCYTGLIEKGIAPEQARMVLPQNMMTEWYWSGTLGAFGDMLKLRLDPHAQKESRDVAELIKGIVEPLFPVSLKAMLEN